jgi:hypothetical protein
MATQIKLRRDTNTNWTTNSTVVLAEGEIGVNLTSGQFKLGDGSSTWAQLTYFSEDRFDATGALVYPVSALQRDTDTVTCLGNASTVVYTGSSNQPHTIKLLIQVEGNVGAAVNWDTQACEMIVIKKFNGPTVAASVYAVVHTSAAPLATFTAEWNAVTSRVEVICTPTGANEVNVKSFATEITTAD